LTEASQSIEVCGGLGGGDLTMWEAHDDETFTFVPGTQVTVDLFKTQPLSLFTAGVEVDGYGRRPFPEVTAAILTPPGLKLSEIFQNPALDWFHAVELFQSFVRTHCFAVDDNDELGSINKFFDPPGYEASKHVDKVSNGDFVIRYTINVVPGGVIGAAGGTAKK